MLTPKQRVMTTLRGEKADKIPFTVYSNMIPRCSEERKLRNRGLCIVHRTNSYKIVHPNVKITSLNYKDINGRNLVKTSYETPYGELSTLNETAGFTSWTHEHVFKRLDDYKALLFYINDSEIVPDYDRVIKEEKNLGDDFVVRDQIPYEPLQEIISTFMGTEKFCFEWMDNRDEIMKLYDALVERNRKIYNVVAHGPLEFANYGGNVVPQIIGVDNFEKYYVPNYNEAAQIMHENNKLLGSHFDADNTLIMDLIGKTDLDYIEAYDAGISPAVKEARKLWKNKTLWLNWPSAWQLYDIEDIYIKTKQLIDEAGSRRKFIIGITEDVPEERWRQNYNTILDAIDNNN